MQKAIITLTGNALSVDEMQQKLARLTRFSRKIGFTVQALTQEKEKDEVGICEGSEKDSMSDLRDGGIFPPGIV